MTQPEPLGAPVAILLGQDNPADIELTRQALELIGVIRRSVRPQPNVAEVAKTSGLLAHVSRSLGDFGYKNARKKTTEPGIVEQLSQLFFASGTIGDNCSTITFQKRIHSFPFSGIPCGRIGTTSPRGARHWSLSRRATLRYSS